MCVEMTHKERYQQRTDEVFEQKAINSQDACNNRLTHKIKEIQSFPNKMDR